MRIWIYCFVFICIVSAGTVSVQALTVGNGESRSFDFLEVSGGEEVLVHSGGNLSCLLLDIGSQDSGNSLEVTGVGSVVEAGYVNVGADRYNYLNYLTVTDGAVLRTTSSLGINGTETSGVPSSSLRNYASVSGSGSLLDIAGNLSLSSPDLSAESGTSLIPCNLTVSGGADVSVGGGVYISPGNSFSLSGSTLHVGSDFNVSMDGFSYGNGSTICVDGQLSGLSLLEAGNRLETSSLLGNLTVHGTFAPGNSPADSILDGDLTIAPDGTLEMEMGGYELGTEYDRLTVTGASVLDGTLSLDFLDSFSPTNGASFDLFNWEGGVSGAFASIDSSSLSGGLYWDTTNLYTDGQLSVIPEPTSAALILLVGGLFYVKKRMRT